MFHEGGQPIEEISKLKINVFNQCDDKTIRLVAEMLKHIDQLESDKQKLIENSIPKEKVEEKIKYIQEEGYWEFIADRDADKCEEILKELLEGK